MIPINLFTVVGLLYKKVKKTSNLKKKLLWERKLNEFNKSYKEDNN